MANRTRSRRARDRTVPSRMPSDRSLLDAIAEGALDDHLGAIASAVDARRRLLHTIDSSHMLATLCVGDRVRIGQRVRPRYRAGLDGTIVELDDRAATVSIPQSGASRAAACVALRWCSRSPDRGLPPGLELEVEGLAHEIGGAFRHPV